LIATYEFEILNEFIPAFAELERAGSRAPEACVNLHRTLQLIESHGMQVRRRLESCKPAHMVDEV